MAGRKKTNYLNNENLLREIRLSKDNAERNPDFTPAEALTPALVTMLRMIANGISQKYNWRNYSYVEDMRGEAEFALCANALKFNEEKSQNPFGYYTQIVWSCFVSTLEKEKKVSKIRDAMLEDLEMMPSFRRQAENEEQQRQPQQRDELVRKTADDERQETTLKQQYEAISEVGKLLATLGPETPMDELVAKMKLVFPEVESLISPTMFEHFGAATVLMPQEATWDIDRNVPKEYGVAALLKVVAPSGSKLSKGLTTDAPEEAALALVRMALAVRRDTLKSENKGLIERSLRWTSKTATSSPKADEGTVVGASDEKKKRGRKPKAKTA